MSVPQTEATTDPQSIIAALQQKLDAALLEKAALAEELAVRTAELLERKSKFDERIEYQAATPDVLRAMSASPGDSQPVFQLIVERARAFCGADQTNLALLDGDTLHLEATSGSSTNYPAQFPRPVDATSMFGRAIIARDVVQTPDVLVDPDHFRRTPNAETTVRAVVAVPLLRRRAPVGAIAMARNIPGEFSVTQIELVKTFAEQAVIAITSAETYRGLHEALEQQTATAEVLQVINANPGDLAPVFDAMLEKAMRLCEAGFGSLYTYDGDRFQSVAQRGVSAAYAAYRERHPPVLVGGAGLERSIRTRRAVQIADMMAERPYLDGNPNVRAMVDLGGVRTAVAVPLCKDETVLGMISVLRQEVRPFSERQIALLESFAAQAVIAMENARLLTEQREALEQQTATAEVLQVINASPGNLAPVFDTILEKAHTLCGAEYGVLLTYSDERFWPVAVKGDRVANSDSARSGIRPGFGFGRLVRGERLLHIHDMAQVAAELPEDPVPRALFEISGIRTQLAVPLRRDDKLLGIITANRREVRPFSEKEIALLENFAAQAVIAMENARLLTEQQEALEQQTATAEVLQVINASPGNLTPVFDAMLERAMRLCDATYGHFRTYDGEGFPLAAVCGDPSLVEWHRQAYAYFVPGPHNPISRFRRGERLIHISDAAASEAYRGDLGWREFVDTGACRSVLAVALRKDTVLLGYISVYRREVRPFSAKQIALLESFAAQAVIAIENARLLDEIRQRQEELRVTFENMGDGVAMFDETPHLVAWNSKFQEIFDVPDALLAEQRTYADYIRYLAERGDYGPGTDVEEQVHRITGNVGQHRTYERTRPDGRVIEIRNNPVAGGGFVLIFSDITERKRNEAEIRAARDAAQEASRTIEAAYRELKTAQAT